MMTPSVGRDSDGRREVADRRVPFVDVGLDPRPDDPLRTLCPFGQGAHHDTGDMVGRHDLETDGADELAALTPMMFVSVNPGHNA